MKKSPETKKNGRPRVHEDGVARQRAYRAKQREDHTRIDAYIEASASWRLDRLAGAWNVSRGGAIQRLLMEADDRYEEILFPVTE